MKVKDLLAKLQRIDPETIIVLSSDGEGNGYSPLDEVSIGVYVPDNTWSGEVYSIEDVDEYDFDEDQKKDCIVFSPMN